jgi:hypothetical protein
MVAKVFVWSEATVGPGRRVTVGQDLVKEVPWLTGSDSIEAWILTLEPGRYRIIPKSDFETNRELKEIVERFTAIQLGTLETALEADSRELAVLPSRLLPVIISPPPPSWRLKLSSVPLFDATGEEIKKFILMPRRGYVELWSARRFAHAQGTPIEDLLA